MAQLDRNPETLEHPAGREAGYAISAHYDRRDARVVVELNTGIQLSFPQTLPRGLPAVRQILRKSKSARLALAPLAAARRRRTFPRSCRAYLERRNGWLGFSEPGRTSAQRRQASASRKNGQRAGVRAQIYRCIAETVCAAEPSAPLVPTASTFFARDRWNAFGAR